MTFDRFAVDGVISGAGKSTGVILRITPRLAGQNSAYLLDTMAAYATGERANSTVMGPLMQSLSPTDRKPIAEYLAALR